MMPRMHVPIGAVVLTGLLAACAATAPAGADAAPDAPPAVIPVFASDDARVGTAGFVGSTLRLHEERGGARYTLMAFAVGDVVTLGAMVRDAVFRGRVRWRVGARVLEFPFDTESPGDAGPVTLDGARSEFAAKGAAFRTTKWANVDLPAAWFDGGTGLQLRFVAEGGEVAVLPVTADCYRATLVPAPR
jgi:hypothetical protein